MTGALTSPATVYAWTATAFTGAPAALFALDHALADILRSTTKPIVGQMRLTWWYDALERLGENVPAQPVLQALAREVVPGLAQTAALAQVVEGWEALLEEPLDAAAVARHGARGEALFGALTVARGMPVDAAVLAAGRGWAMADLAVHLADVRAAALARVAAGAALDEALTPRWRGARVLGALALDSRMALAGQGSAGSPRRAARVLRFGLTGR